jgi:hypothetical protein
MSLVDDYNKGKIDAVELNRRLNKLNEEKKQGRYLTMIVLLIFTVIGGIVYGYVNHTVDVSNKCRAKYPIEVGVTPQEDIDALLELQALCRKGKA